jgi:hypothetical protein
METEAWFLGEYTHFRRVSKKLTPGFIEQHLGFNPQSGNMEERDRPAEDLKRVYRLADQDYTKKRIRLNHIVDKLDFHFFTGKLAGRMNSLGEFVTALDRFFE